MDEILICDSFFYEAEDFFQSGKIVKESEQRFYYKQFLSSPIAYQFRHSMELLLKAYIIRMEIENGNLLWNEKKYLDEKRRLFSVHSLHGLLNILEEEFSIDNQMICAEDKLSIKTLDELDFDSTFFRYPCDRALITNSKDFERAYDRVAFREAPCCIGNILYHGDTGYYTDQDFDDSIIEIETSFFDSLSRMLSVYREKYLDE